MIPDMLAETFGPAPDATKPPHRLGSLSERYESGGRGPGTVSSGLHDPGGVSYGLYQLATRPGTVAAFVAAEGACWKRDFGGKTPGTPAFSSAWQAIAKRQPDAFGAAQHAFIERTHYRPAVCGVKTATRLDLDQRADAVRDACWSAAVQHGAVVKLLCRAVAVADHGQDRGAADYDLALLRAIYAARSEYLRSLAGRMGKGEGTTLIGIVEQRYPAELAAAEALLPAQG